MCFIKNIRRQAFGLTDFDYFGLVLWEQTHRPNRQRTSARPRPYNRTKKRNARNAKQTTYRWNLKARAEAAQPFLHGKKL